MGFCLLTNIKRDVPGFNNREPEALVEELPLCNNTKTGTSLRRYHRCDVTVGTKTEDVVVFCD